MVHPAKCACRRNSPPSLSNFKRSSRSYTKLVAPTFVNSRTGRIDFCTHSRIHFYEKMLIWPLLVASSSKTHISGRNGAKRNEDEALLNQDALPSIRRS